jgi:hypothetical protein
MLSDVSGLMLFHGGIAEVEHIDLSNSRNKLDFGKGFYTTTSYKQACRWSEIKFSRDKGGKAVKAVSKYSISNFDGLNIKEFPVADSHWLAFVVNNRLAEVHSHEYDIVIGPIADDTTLLVINTYMLGLYGSGENAVNMAISLLKPEMLENQYAFCTEKAVSRLTYEGCDYLD